MNLDFEVVLQAAVVGIGGTIALDAWAVMLQILFKTPGTNWAMVGRWLGHMPKGKYRHDNIAAAAPVVSEAFIGWTFHYGIGIGYGLLLIILKGSDWLIEPTVTPAVVLSLVLLIAPYFIMMPGLGLGIAGSKTPKPNVTRIKSVFGHTMFGLGMYGTALAMNNWS